MTRSAVVELCISLGLGAFERMYVKKGEERKQEVKNEDLSDRYMRRVLFGGGGEWTPV